MTDIVDVILMAIAGLALVFLVLLAVGPDPLHWIAGGYP